MAKKDKDYAKHYSEDQFRNKLVNYGKLAGAKVTYGTLLLFYTLKKPTVPMKAKSSVLGALGYFIFPFDIVPDFIPIAGYVDDFGVILVSLLIIATYIDADSKRLARAKIVEWFGEDALKDADSVDQDIEMKTDDDAKV